MRDLGCWIAKVERSSRFPVFNMSVTENNGFEAVRSLVDWAFDQPKLRCMTAYCPEDNTPSKRMLQKLGMQRQEIVDIPDLPDREVWKWQL